MCDALEVQGKDRKTGAAGILRFSSLYRSACADLALADSYQLPPSTVSYLHRLVARSHNRLYRSSRLDLQSWSETLFRDAPRQIFADPCVHVATLLFFGLFCLSSIIALNESWFPDYAGSLMGDETINSLQSMYEQPIQGSLDHYLKMAGFYIMHNTAIGLQCFAYGILVLPCLISLSYNAIILGASFGYMSRADVSGGDHFLHFVTAHGPFELTAICLSGAAGLRLGWGLFDTKGLIRSESLRLSARNAVPVMVAAAILFFLAAITEGFLSPSPLPYFVKVTWAVMSTAMIAFYFVILGAPQDLASDDREDRVDPLAVDPLAVDPLAVDPLSLNPLTDDGSP